MLHRSRLFDVTRKVCVVTGGGQGIGYMIAQAFIENGAKVYIGSRKGTVLESAAHELNEIGPGVCIPIEADLGSHKGCEAFANAIKKFEPKLDVLVNNSGCTWGAPLEAYPDAAWDKVMALNVKSVFQLTVACLPLLESAGTLENPSRVINIGSVTGINANAGLYPEMYAYSTSKAAVHHLTQSLASKLTGRGITVNAIACGAFATRMMRQTLDDHGEAITNSSPLHRIGKSTDIAGTVLYLSSDAGSWVSGAVIPLEGGALVASKE
eukprot:PhM_4_TR17067/c0_g1_i3/m.91337